MIKLPEPYMTLQGKKRGKLSGEAMPFYTEAQIKQAVRDALEEAAGLCGGPATGDVIRTTEEDNIRFELADAILALKDKP